jgi:hypothetical protein
MQTQKTIWVITRRKGNFIEAIPPCSRNASVRSQLPKMASP